MSMKIKKKRNQPLPKRLFLPWKKEKQAEKENEIEKEIRDCNVLEMTPIEALNFYLSIKRKNKRRTKIREELCRRKKFYAWGYWPLY